MGKGDKRTKRGKIYRGTHGLRRPKKKDQKEMMKNVKSMIKTTTVIFFVCILTACSAEKIDITQPPDYQKFFTTVNPEFMITTSEALAWHQYKDQFGPTYSGNKSWHKFLSFTKKKIKNAGHQRSYL
jgi:30S ribosomal protein S31